MDLADVLPTWTWTEASGIAWPSITMTGAVAIPPIIPLAVGSIATVIEDVGEDLARLERLRGRSETRSVDAARSPWPADRSCVIGTSSSVRSLDRWNVTSCIERSVRE